MPSRRSRIVWQIHRLNLALGIVALMGIAQFIVSVLIAIAKYHDYSLTENFLSDLGASRMADGSRNDQVALIFNFSMILLGISLIPFYLVLPSVFETGKPILRVAGVLSAAGLIGIGLTPYDTLTMAHNVALGMWVGATLCMVITMLISVRADDGTSAAFAIATLVMAIGISTFSLSHTHQRQAVSQKAMVFVAILWTFVTVATVSVSAARIVSPGHTSLKKAVRRYLRALKHAGRRDSK